jgi:methionyl-tRNA synthetase
MAKRFYVTTPIYYVNSVPHIGHAVTTLAADVTKRYHQFRGEPSHFLTGTDENGLKILEAAETRGLEPQAFVDEISQQFKTVWESLNLEYDDFIRTTETRHKEAVEKFLEILTEKGYCYQGNYEGWYDVSTETFYQEDDLVDGKSPEGNEVRWVQEENWFFKLSAFQDRLTKHIESHPEFITPPARRNEVLSFIKQGLRDVCITRANPGWGIPVPGDENKVVYVWFDALINYVAATGWPETKSEELWPAEVQYMAKDILTRFHATLWPAMLMGVGLPLPKHLVGHSYLLFGGEKMSKSRGNVVAPADLSAEIKERTGTTEDLARDAVRHYMVSTLPYETDYVFTHDDFEKRYNADLANDLGNALNRSISMANKFVDGRVPGAGAEPAVRDAIDRARRDYEGAMNENRLDRASHAAFELVRFLNKYIDQRAPWSLAKNEDSALAPVLFSMLLSLRTVEGLVRPILPATADAVAEQLGHDPLTSWEQVGREDSLKAGTILKSPEPMFPRLELKKPEAPAKKEPGNKEKKKSKKGMPEPPAEIEIGDFFKVQLRVARIIDAQEIEKSDKLLRLKVKVGHEERQVVAGIKKAYSPEDLIGRQVVVVANLKPARLMGEESQGMILAADDADGSPILLEPEREAPEGTSVH